MAIGDLLLKLLLHTGDFDRNLGKSRQKVEGFGQDGKKVFEGLGNAVTKMAGVLGVSLGAYDLFKRGIESSQAATDAWGVALRSVNGVLDGLVYTIANFDPTRLNMGLGNMIERAREAYEAYDDLANVVLATNYAFGEDQTGYRKAISRARNKMLSFEEREAALTSASHYRNEMLSSANVQKQTALDAINAAIGEKIGVNLNITDEQLDRILRVDTEENRHELRNNARETYERIVEPFNQTMDAIGMGNEFSIIQEMLQNPGMVWKASLGELVAGDVIEEATANFVSQANANAEALATHALLLIKSDEELTGVINNFQSAKRIVDAAIEAEASINEVTTTLRSEKAAVERSVAATDRQTAARISNAEALNSNTRSLSVPVIPGMAGISFDNSFFHPAAFIGPGAATRRYNATNGASDLPSSVAPLNTSALPEVDFLRATFEMIKELKDYAEGVSLLSDAFTQLGSSIGGSANTLGGFIGSLGDAVVKMIEFISYIQAEKLAQDAAADSALTAAAAKAMSAHAGIPFAGIALGAAAVAALVNVVTSLPKLANGGIATGPTVGLFGEAGTEAIIPLDRLEEFINTPSRNIRVTGTLKAQGKDLYAVLDSYSKVQSIK